MFVSEKSNLRFMNQNILEINNLIQNVLVFFWLLNFSPRIFYLENTIDIGCFFRIDSVTK